jgi:serine/threonine protein kinase
MIGKVLQGTYRIEAKLGRGGMGTVYRAAHIRLPKQVAIKVLHGGVRAGESGYRRFQREAEIASSLKHPNIIEVFDFNETSDGEPYIVMELLEGEDLAARIEDRGALDLPSTLEVARSVARGLVAAHARGIVHRDIKPHNVFLCREADTEVVKVLDFGISKIVGSPEALTRSSAIIGTPNYMAPEQTRGGNSVQLDARADQFSLGAMVVEMLTGRRPFEQAGDTPLTILQRIATELPQPIEGVPDPVMRVLEKALAKQPEERFEDVLAFTTALGQAADGQTVNLTPRSGTLKPVRTLAMERRSSGRLMRLGLPALVVAAAMLASVFWWRYAARPPVAPPSVIGATNPASATSPAPAPTVAPSTPPATTLATSPSPSPSIAQPIAAPAQPAPAGTPAPSLAVAPPVHAEAAGGKPEPPAPARPTGQRRRVSSSAPPREKPAGSGYHLEDPFTR